MIVHMCKLQIVVLYADFERLLQGLQHLRYLHLEDTPLGEAERIGALKRMLLTEEDEHRRRVLAAAKRSVDELVVALGAPPEPEPEEVARLRGDPPEKLLDLATEMLRKVRSLRRRRNNLLQDRRALQRYMQTGRLLRHVSLFGDETQVLMFVYRTEERLVARELQEQIDSLHVDAVQLRFFRAEARKSVAVVVCPRHLARRVRHVAWESGTLEFKLPAAYQSDRLTESFDRIDADLDAMPDRLAELDAKLVRLRDQVGPYAAALEQLCAEEIERIDARQNIAQGSFIRVLQAFAPVDRKDEVRTRVVELTDDRAIVEEIHIGPHLENVPVVLQNSRFAKPFEILLKIFPPPTYGTLDPTPINAIGVPFFFGMIVGDIGYGLVILLLATWIGFRYRSRETVRSVATIGMYCAISTMLFGLVYGELFGALGQHLGLHPVLHREDPRSLLLLLKIALCVGAAHVTIGLLLGILNARVFIDRHAFKERLGQLLCLLGVVLVVAAVVTHITPLFGVAALSGVVGIGTLVWGAGIVGLLEVFSLLSNVLSYARLMALGMASVVMALVANRMFRELDFGVTGLLVAIVLHGLNILIGMFSPTIHTLRLHYVEFFSKFYRSGGKDYVRFGEEIKHTQ